MMNEVREPLVSIIINCYNGEQYLREAIDSIYSQSYIHWEIIFWDNSSTDNSSKIAKSYDSKLRYFRGADTIPLGDARNKALEHCMGEYIAFLDTDDLWFPFKLEFQVAIMKQNPSAVACYSDGYDLYDETKSGKKFSSYPNITHYEGKIFEKLIINNFINWQTVLINTNKARKELFFDENLTYSEDHEILLRLSLKGTFKYLPKPLIYYRYHSNNMSNDRSLIIQESEYIFHKFEDLLGSNKHIIKKARANLYGTTVIKAIKNDDDYREYIKYLIQYPNFQNIILFTLLKLKIALLLRLLR
jgi:glycosyltransferase involved in cell wall biosynthesis